MKKSVSIFIKTSQIIFFGRYELRANLNTVHRLTAYGGNSLYLFEENIRGNICHSTNFYGQTLIKVRRKYFRRGKSLYRAKIINICI